VASIEAESYTRYRDFNSPGEPVRAAKLGSNRRQDHAARRVVLVGGGTAGHVYPALAIANAYRKEVTSLEVLFFGTDDGFEAKLVPRYGYRLSVVRSRPLVGESLLRKARSVGSLGSAVLQARRMLIAAKPDLVIGFGGYASVPTILAARSLRVPTAVHECNAIAGLANKMLAQLVDRVYLGFETATRQFRAGRVLVTGNPVRPDVGALGTQRHHPPSPERPARILVTGGSQGSSFLNRHVPRLLSRLAAGGLTLDVLHQSGQADSETVREAYREAGLSASVAPFVDDMAAAYQWADFAIACSGAATLAEVSIVGLPALLVPLLTAAKNHQSFNAAAFASVTGSSWLNEDDWLPDVLVGQIARLFRDPVAWREASESVRRFAKPDASRTLVDDCEAIVRAGRHSTEGLRHA
jgi:UDP-N-acetylglucosamine--N-acetylmuramyl-(pentapeptide) pyrophosphoryl-undecaprenol N-acetylglucosamine transferase